MSLVKRFVIICFSASIFFSVVLGLLITSSLEQNMIRRSEELTATFIIRGVNRYFTTNDFNTPKIDQDYEDFQERTNRIIHSADIERVKIWDKRKKIIWSDEKQLIGQVFLDNLDLNRALTGETVAKISDLKKKEHQFEQKFNKLLELYVPISFGHSQDVDAVFEIYRNLDPLYRDIFKQKLSTWIILILGFGVLFLTLLGIVVNASRRIESQNKEIKMSEKRYRSLVQSAKDGIISIDKSGKVILFNEAAEHMFRYTSGEVIGHSLEMLMPERFREKHQVASSRLFKKGNATVIGKTIELEGLRKDGGIFPLELSLSTPSITDNVIVTAIIRDITERKVMQEHLLKSEMHKCISTIAGSIGHEINNLACSLIGYAELLQQELQNEELALECAEVFSTQSQRLKLHADNLLELSKPRKVERKAVNVNQLLNKVTKLLLSSGLLKLYKIIKRFSDDVPTVLGDENLLEQVISNLEINSAHAMGTQGVLTLSTGVSKNDSNYVEMTIKDTGHGIAEDKRHQIFLPFYTTKEKVKGTGLGMYIVKEIIDQHKGYIQLDSKVGIGTTITIGLPLI